MLRPQPVFPNQNSGIEIPRPQVWGLGISIFIGSTWTPLWSMNPYLRTTGFSWNLLFSRSEWGDVISCNPNQKPDSGFLSQEYPLSFKNWLCPSFGKPELENGTVKLLRNLELLKEVSLQGRKKSQTLEEKCLTLMWNDGIDEEIESSVTKEIWKYCHKCGQILISHHYGLLMSVHAYTLGTEDQWLQISSVAECCSPVYCSSGLVLSLTFCRLRVSSMSVSLTEGFYQNCGKLLGLWAEETRTVGDLVSQGTVLS